VDAGKAQKIISVTKAQPGKLKTEAMGDRGFARLPICMFRSVCLRRLLAVTFELLNIFKYKN
jgi:hypothetical protein